MDAASRFQRWQVLVGFTIVAVLVGCSGASSPPSPTRQWTPAPTPTPIATPTPAPTPAPTATADQLAAVCYGTAVPLAAPYAGTVHPLVVAEAYPGSPAKLGDPTFYAINQKWRDDQWPSPIQLVVCDRGDSPKKVSYCGRYTGGGTTIRVWVGQARETVEVVVASTGKVLQKKVLTNPAPNCPAIYSSPVLLDNDVVTNSVTWEQVSKYATAVSKQPVK